MNDRSYQARLRDLTTEMREVGRNESRWLVERGVKRFGVGVYESHSGTQSCMILNNIEFRFRFRLYYDPISMHDPNIPCQSSYRVLPLNRNRESVWHQSWFPSHGTSFVQGSG